jgi:hypothetical protein
MEARKEQTAFDENNDVCFEWMKVYFLNKIIFIRTCFELLFTYLFSYQTLATWLVEWVDGRLDVFVKEWVGVGLAGLRGRGSVGEGQRAGEQVLVGQQGQQTVRLGARGYSKIRQKI